MPAVMIVAAVAGGGLVACVVLVTAQDGGRDQSAASTSEPEERLRVITGEVLVEDLVGALGPLVDGPPGMTMDQMSMRQLNRVGEILDDLEAGKTFPCPEGPGGGYDDLRVGGQVVISNGAGKVLATSQLQGGVLSGEGCSFNYGVEVPADDFYSVTVTHRGALTVSREELESSDWHVTSRI